jgi:polysaccharide pyruvyl transferase WcaK-like protein
VTPVHRPYIVALHGSYHTDNFGDMLLMALYKRWLLETAEGIEVRMPFVPPRTAVHLDPGPRRGALALRDVESFVYGGGGYFGEPPSRQRQWGRRLIVRHLLPGLALASLGRDIVISGVGAGPLTHRWARRALARVAERASLITVRDEASRAEFVELGLDSAAVQVTADAALVLDEAAIPERARLSARKWLDQRPAERRLGVHVGRPSSTRDSHAAILDDVVAFAVARPDLRIVALNDQRGAAGQLAAAEELSSRLPGRCDEYRYRDPWELTALLGAMTMVVTTKLHVGIVAAALGTPVLSYPNHPKVPRFYEQIGAPDATHPQATLRPGRVRDHLEGRFDRAEGAVTVPEAVRAAADANRTLLQAHLRSRI